MRGMFWSAAAFFGVSTDHLLYGEYEEPSAPFGGQAPGAPSPKKRAFARIVPDGCSAGLGAVGMLILGISASLYPACYVENPAGIL